jgi:hypothetical protein
MRTDSRKATASFFAAMVCATASSVLLSPSASASPSGTGCPGGFQLRSVAELAATGNAPVPAQVDAAGNGDGMVCAHALPDQACTPYVVQWDLPACLVETFYHYIDNDHPTR